MLIVITRGRAVEFRLSFFTFAYQEILCEAVQLLISDQYKAMALLTDLADILRVTSGDAHRVGTVHLQVVVILNR